MVKGVSRQVIVVQSPDRKVFEQAIFILRDGQQGITDEVLLKEANRLIGKRHSRKAAHISAAGPLWAVSGALVTGLVWFFTTLM